MKKNLICILMGVSCMLSCQKEVSKTKQPTLTPNIISGKDNKPYYIAYSPLTPDPSDPTGNTFTGIYNGYNLKVTSLSYDYADYPTDIVGTPALGNMVAMDPNAFISQSYIKGSASYFVITSNAPIFNLSAYNKDLDAFQDAFGTWFQSLPDDLTPTPDDPDPLNYPGPPEFDSFVESSYMSSGSKITTTTCKLIRVTDGQYAIADAGYPQPVPDKPVTPAQPIMVGQTVNNGVTYYIRGTNGNLNSVSITPNYTPTAGYKVTGTYTFITGTAECTFTGLITRPDGTTFIIHEVNQDLS